jgi:pimeloyl-ACP methyl ester carboxylesterase
MPMSRAPARVLALRAVFTTVGSVAPGIAARWAESIFCTPPRREAGTTDEAFLARGRRFSVRSEGQELAAWEWGVGATILLVHGWGSRAGRFSPMAAALVDAGFRVVAHDGPAHGASTGRFASLPEFARALRAVGDAVGPAHGVVGHSLGGAAVVLALRDGLAAERVVLLATPADVGRFTTAFEDYMRLSPVTRTAMRRNLEQRLRMRWDEVHLPAIARSLAPPALLIHDRADPDVPHAEGAEIAEAWAGARLVSTQGLGHRALPRDAAVIQEVLGFMREGRPR